MTDAEQVVAAIKELTSATDRLRQVVADILTLLRERL